MRPSRHAASIAVVLFVAALHWLRIGDRLPGEWRRLHASYCSDLVLPFGFYFLLCAAEGRMPLLRPPRTRPALAFLNPAAMETAQAFGLRALGATFDPADYAMYFLGAAAAAATDRWGFRRLGPE